MRFLIIAPHHRQSRVTEPLEGQSEAIIIPYYVNKGIVQIPKIIFDVVQSIISHNFSGILLNEGSGAVGLPITIIARIASIPVITRLGGDTWREHSEKMREYYSFRMLHILVAYYLHTKLLYAMYYMSSGFIVVSEELKEITLKNTEVNPEQVKVVPLHIDVTKYPEYSEEKIDYDLLSVTNLNYKGKFMGILDILDEYSDTICSMDLHYAIAGDGMYLPELKSQIKQLPEELQSQITILGYVEDVKRLYECSRIFIYYSYMDGYPNAVIEAQASGLPVIANSAHGMLEQIENGKDGLLLNPGNPSKNNKILIGLASNDGLREKLGRNAIHTRQRDSADRIGELLSEAMEEMTSNYNS